MFRDKLRGLYYYILRKRLQESFGTCGKGLQLYGIPRVIYPRNISVGDNLELNHGSILNATDSYLRIGNNVTISAGAQVLATTYDIDSFMKENKREHISKKTVIGDYVWICAGAIVLPGVQITGSHVIIGANAVVTRDITESCVVLAGNPAKIVKKYCEN